MVAALRWREVAEYLEALASLVTALPVVAILWAFGVPFPGMWGVLAFVGNFIPYVGGLVAFVLPVLLAFLELEPVWPSMFTPASSLPLRTSRT